MSVDLRWMPGGDLLIDGNGDIAVTDSASNESIIDLVQTRLKAAFNGWKLYQLGADLQSRIGELNNPETELRIQRQTTASLSDILAPGSFEVQTLAVTEGTVTVLVYLRSQLIAQLTLAPGDRTN